MTPGRALIQTYMPDQPVMQALAAGDRDGFLAAEANARREAGLPLRPDRTNAST
jgi:primosomal protein N' (replication factor Y)